MTVFRTLLLAAAVAVGLTGAALADPPRDSQRAFEATREGRSMPLPQLERRVHVQPVGFGEAVRVAVGRRQHEVDELAPAERLAADRHILHRHAVRALHREEREERAKELSRLAG